MTETSPMAAGNPTSWLPSLPGRLGSLPARLVGPIFTKELRVSSRRRRNFVLRAVYLAVLTAFVALVWMGSVKWSVYGSYAYRIAHMEQAGKTIIASVVWFQFIAVLLVTVIMLSTSISEEVYHRTLGVLMTTPINSFQVVIGKLLSKMLQLIVLLAMSLPLLAVVRVLGGVPWYFVVSGLCITLATGVFFASVTMFFSILFRRAFVSILLTLGTMAVLYLGIPLIVVLMLVAAEVDSQKSIQPLLTLLLHYNPFPALSVHTIMVFEPRVPASLGTFYWWGNCLVSLGLSAVVIGVCVAMVRRVALRQAAGS
ncbi:MAG: ABC transporter permease subunit, partial [Phycisphaerae bacterium]